MYKKNISTINISKGIGILLVVLGHVVVPEIRQNSSIAAGLFGFIYSFHMPLFIAISGFLFELYLEKYIRKGFRVFFLAKFRTLIIPYICLSIFSYVGINAAFHIPTLSGVLRNAGYQSTGLMESAIQILTSVQHLDKHMWFVYALFVIFILSFTLPKLLKNPLVLLAVYLGYHYLAFLQLPEILLQIMKYLVYFNLARYTGVVQRFMDKKMLLPAATVLVVLYGFTLLNLPYVNIALDLLVAIAGSLTVLSFSALLESSKIAGYLESLGSYSYDIYLLHQPFIVSGIAGLLLTATPLPYLLICGITLVLGIAVPILLSKYIIRRFQITRLLFLGGH